MPLYDEQGRMIPGGSYGVRYHHDAPALEIRPSPAAATNASPTPVQNGESHSAASSSQRPQVEAAIDGRPMPADELDRLLRHMLCIGEGVSDLFFVVGHPPQVELYGELQDVGGSAIGGLIEPAHTAAIALAIMGTQARLHQDLRETGSCDTAYALDEAARFRVNIFKQRGTYALVLRKLSTKIASMDELGLPPVFRKIIKEKTGLVFVTGATGSGKTTTLAAMLNELNHNNRIHIVTLEDPVEYLHPQRVATFSQRELGRDFSSFAAGLRAALRQAPKVILVGEIRDRETMEIALTAAETGHIVFSTLHTISAGQSVQRVLGMFEKDEEKQVRDRLAEVLRWVVSQRLAPKVGGGRIMIPEIMGSNLRTREMIQLGENEVRNIQDIIEASRPDGWCSFEQSLGDAFVSGSITEETAMLLSVNKSRMRRALDMALKKLGRDNTTTDGLRLSEDEASAGKVTPMPAPRAATPPPMPMPNLQLRA